jgi:glyoxylase-like metal-dependent hydrolase (beta-lactamase superfamily II)
MSALLLVAYVSLGPGVHLLRGTFVPGTQPDGNTVVLRGTDGLVVVDTGRHVEHTQQIVDFARQAGVPVKAIVNTHWHLDHVGGNGRLRREFPKARVLASGAIVEAQKGFLADYRKYLEGQVEKVKDHPEKQKPLRAELLLIDSGAALVPDDRITSSGRHILAGRELQIGLEGPAVTAGDVWVLDVKTKTLVAGDLVTLPAPFLDTACPKGWSAALAHLSAAEFETLVPGHGAPMSREEFSAYRKAFDGLLACATLDKPKDACIDGWITGLGQLLPASDHKFTRSLVEYYLDAHLRGDPAKQAKLCETSSPR